MAEVTILGARGFVGSRLRAAFEAEGADVYAPAKGDPAMFERDLGAVYYCAGLTADYAVRPFDTVEAHATLVAALARSGRFSRLIYTSSTRLYDTSSAALMAENQPLIFRPDQPRQIYDLSKALGENITLTQMGGKGGVARLSNVFDWQDDSPGFLSEWLIAARSQKTIALESSPHIARDYIHVDDVVRALRAMIDAPEPGIVNVASGELVDNGAIARTFELAGYGITFSGSGNPPPVPCADVAKLRALGVDPRPVRAVIAEYLASRDH
ncbi:nucleoside-diphosphate-sugar epimerase [Phenylobacterium haematophilum]|uniref:Nucleoside-diphosphate-sugar epimerase n=1 Tax=Phenylobacterium haematophilum TaxID=98513 RepID=A0A840A2N6_9CAUL|nr:NAD(P)-dependent oxidoreductase [Phenylobacterium haematophilum]MBB3891567.1 nucleoside-diphosphate-sugar epimerase [Phenylobacterium haematophilum]